METLLSIASPQVAKCHCYLTPELHLIQIEKYKGQNNFTLLENNLLKNTCNILNISVKQLEYSHDLNFKIFY